MCQKHISGSKGFPNSLWLRHSEARGRAAPPQCQHLRLLQRPERTVWGSRCTDRCPPRSSRTGRISTQKPPVEQEWGVLGDGPRRRWAGSLPGVCFPIRVLWLPLTRDPWLCDSQLELGSPAVQICRSGCVSPLRVTRALRAQGGHDEPEICDL